MQIDKEYRELQTEKTRFRVLDSLLEEFLIASKCSKFVEFGLTFGVFITLKLPEKCQLASLGLCTVKLVKLLLGGYQPTQASKDLQLVRWIWPRYLN